MDEPEEYLNSLPRTRKEALERGTKYYYTGKPCKRGHLAKRRKTTRVCIKCAGIASTEYRRRLYQEDPEYCRQLARDKYRKNPEPTRERNARNYYRRIGRLDLYQQRKRSPG